MYTGKLVFSQLMEHLPWDTFHRYVKLITAITKSNRSSARSSIAARPLRSLPTEIAFVT